MVAIGKKTFAIWQYQVLSIEAVGMIYSMHEVKKQKLFLTTSENCWDGVTVFFFFFEAVGMTLMTSKAIKSKLSQQTSATLFLSVLISLSSDEVHGLIHMMLGERR